MTENAEDKKKQEEAARLASAQNEAKEVTSSSSANAVVRILKVEPGSYVSLTVLLLQD